jgi:DNA/RNA-binding domain of Phe-tRNA-synthetase-like protein
MPSGRHETVVFFLAPEVAALGVEVATLAIGGLRNRRSDPAFDAVFTEAIAAIAAGAKAEDLPGDPVLRGFRELHDAIKRSNSRFLAAPENLLRLLLQRGSAPRVNLLVDIYNLVSMQTHLALGAHDLSKLEGDVALRLSRGGEKFHPLGIAEPTSVGPGEYGYFDAVEVICRLEVRQAEKTKVTEETTEAFFIVQGNRRTPPSLFREAVDELVRLVATHCMGKARIIRLPG